MAIIKPFKGIRPPKDLVEKVESLLNPLKVFVRQKTWWRK